MAIAETADAVFVSAATIWEIELKRALDRPQAPADSIGIVDESGFDRVPITLEHAREAARLPRLHGEPFDRMLVAQARLEGLTLATAEAQFGRYGVAVLEVARG